MGNVRTQLINLNLGEMQFCAWCLLFLILYRQKILLILVLTVIVNYGVRGNVVSIAVAGGYYYFLDRILLLSF